MTVLSRFEYTGSIGLNVKLCYKIAKLVKFSSNNLTQKLATGAAAFGVLAGVGMTTSSPAQAAVFGCDETATFDQLMMPGMYIECGDKRFDNFQNFASFSSPPGMAPDKTQVAFTARQTMPGWYILEVQSPAWNVDPGESMDTTFDYDVTSLGGPITSVDLEFGSYDAQNGGGIHIRAPRLIRAY